MKKLFALFIISFFVSRTEISAQNAVKPTTRRDCSSVGRPIVDVFGTSFIYGKAIKIVRPRLNRAAKKLARNASVTVKIEIDENGVVIDAKADGEVPILRNLAEQAARKSRFAPSRVDGAAVKIKGQIFYKFTAEKIEVSYDPEPIKYEPPPVDYERIRLIEMFDRQIVSVIDALREGKKTDSYPFIKNGQAQIQLCMSSKTLEIIEQIKQTGFELLEETRGNGLVGQIVVENLTKLAEIEEIRFIVPDDR